MKKHWISAIALNVVGSAIVAFGLYNVHFVSGITEGGVLGLTLFFEHWLNISPALIGFVLNAICYGLGAFILGRGFIFYSVVAGVCFSGFYAVFEMIGPVFPRISEHPLIAAVIGALFVGIGVGLCVRGGGAPSGDDALSMSLSKLTRLGIQWIYLISDITVLALSLTYISFSKIFYSLVTVILSGQIISVISKENGQRTSR